MRNTDQKFALNPTNLDIQRSKFTRPSSVKFTFNTGELIPFYVDEVMPGDTFQVRTSKVIRLQTMLTPMMDSLFCDVYYFFCPYRLIWEHWREFMGENTASAWIPVVSYAIPKVTVPTGGFNIGTIADYMGVPTGVAAGAKINALPFRAYSLIVDQWFRDENLQAPVVIPMGDSDTAGSNGSNYITDLAAGGTPFVANKLHDWATSALPAPQKGADTTIPFSSGGFAPVVTRSQQGFINGTYSMMMRSTNSAFDFPASSQMELSAVNETSSTRKFGSVGSNVSSTQLSGMEYMYPSNLFANIGSISTTINQLRTAFQIQKFYERNARGGTRYIELIKSHFNVTSPDARMMRPEYLGGNRVPINVNQVIQQSATDSTSPQGNVTGVSLTTDVHGDFTHSFTEHGLLIGLCCVRYEHTYQQGLEPMWYRDDKFDYYWPVFANLGEMAIPKKALYFTGTGTDDQVFGYQEAWWDYRYKASRVAGEMRSSASNSLDSWHLADDYASAPTLGSSWIQEDKANVDRVLAIQSSVSNQLFADFFIQNITTRPMPLYSIPGLIDHH